MKVFLLLVVLIAVFLLTQWGVMRMTKRACRTIIKDLEGKSACKPESAAVLSYAKKKGILHIGTRNYKTQALQYLIHREIVRTTDNGRHYLIAQAQDVRL